MQNLWGMRFLYSLSILFFQWAVFIAGYFSGKARKRALGNKHYKSLAAANDNDQVIWMHCASLGEFEQGRPVLEAYKKLHPEVKVLLTFFSPSGFEVRKNYPLAQWVTYLPFDRPATVKRFIDFFQPDIALFVKYEFWHNYIQELDKRDIPLFLVSGILRENQIFFKYYGGFFRRSLRKINWFFLQNDTSLQLLNSIGIERASITGDTRFDRVLQVAENTPTYAVIEEFCGDNKIFIVGSSWPEDEQILLPVLIKMLPVDWKIIIAPHEISDNHLAKITSYFSQQDFLIYTEVEGRKISPKARVLILDTMGMLSAVYKKADIAYIGGGFGKGIHNTLEAAIFSLPVLFGPRHQQFKEAVELIEAGGAFTFSSKPELQVLVKSLVYNPVYRHQSGQAAANYVHKSSGATEKIVKQLEVVNIKITLN